MVATMTSSLTVMLFAQEEEGEEDEGRDGRALLDDAEGERQVGVHGAQGERKEEAEDHRARGDGRRGGMEGGHVAGRA
jgi:hypothetical protein